MAYALKLNFVYSIPGNIDICDVTKITKIFDLHFSVLTYEILINQNFKIHKKLIIKN